MCFYTQQNAPAKNIKKRFSAEIDIEENLIQSDFINGYSYPNLPVILDTTPDIITTSFNWGLIPNWSKTEDIRSKTLNARIETIEEKASYKNSIQKRCLIIATSYYEWHWNDPAGKSKVKHQINSQEEEIFTFAGLYSNWRNPASGEVKNTFTMITTEANETMQYVHNHKKRMPIMLNKKDELSWLNPDTDINSFAYPYSAKLIAFPI